MASIHEAIADLHGIGAVDKTTMRQFDALCLAADVPEYAPEKIRALRERLSVEPEPKKRYTLAELLARCDQSAPAPEEDRPWTASSPKGGELV
jgi:hypothetical protein